MKAGDPLNIKSGLGTSIFLHLPLACSVTHGMGVGYTFSWIKRRLGKPNVLNFVLFSSFFHVLVL